MTPAQSPKDNIIEEQIVIAVHITRNSLYSKSRGRRGAGRAWERFAELRIRTWVLSETR